MNANYREGNNDVDYGMRTATDMTYIFEINTDKHPQTNALYAKNMYNTHCHAPTILENNRVAGSIPKI